LDSTLEKSFSHAFMMCIDSIYGKWLILVFFLAIICEVRAFAPPSDHFGGRASLFASSNSLDTENPSPSCPLRQYSMSYPRFRIPTSRRRKDASKEWFSGFKYKLDQMSLEKKYKVEVQNNSFYWVDASKIISREANDNKDNEQTSKAKIGIFSVFFIWNTLRTLLDHSSFNDEAVIAMPTSSIDTLVQMSDIINWINENSSDIFVDESCKFSAKIDEEAPTPTIILTVVERVKLSEKDDDSKLSSLLTPEQVKMSTQRWVDRVLVKLGICPFTKSVSKSGQGLSDVGVPVGRIAYHYSKATLKKSSLPLLFADTYEAIYEMIRQGPSGKHGISSILVSVPGFDSSFPIWAGPIFAILEASVGAAKAEPMIGVVCFHPDYKTPDGKSWPGFGHMHSVPRLQKWLGESGSPLSNVLNEDEVAAGGAFQRRTPFATINVLRAEQLEAAEGRRSTIGLYSTNIERLYNFGYDKLEDELEKDRSLKIEK
jgi:hypothetical protein